MSVYDLSTLIEVSRRQIVSQPPFWRQFFPRQINFETPEIMYDKVFDDSRKLAPFVIPTVQGRPQTLIGYTTVAFSPAYIKIKDNVHAQMHLARTAGEPLNVGSFTLDQRRDAVIGYLTGMQRTKIENRWEWLAAKAIIDGQVTIAGEDYPEVTVDFRRDAALSATLTLGARWSQNTGVPLTNIQTMRKLVESKSGVRINRYIFGGNAWDYFCARVDLKAMMDRNYGGLDVNMTRMWDGYEGLEYMGYLQGNNGAGRMEIFVNSSKYIDPDTNTEAFYLDQDTVVGVGSPESIGGIRCFGAIMDAGAGYRPLEVFLKNWINEDPSVEYILSQSAPLMVPKNPDATFSLKVH